MSRSLVIDHLMENNRSQDAAVSYVYCDYREHDGQTAEKLVAILLKQLAISKRDLPQAVNDLYLRFEAPKRQPQQQDLEQAFLLTCRDFEKIYIVIDALDECEASQRRKLLGFLYAARTRLSIRVFITSRSYSDEIIKKFDPIQRLKIEAHKSDLRRYIVQAIENSDHAEVINNDFQQQIVNKVCAAAQNM